MLRGSPLTSGTATTQSSRPAALQRRLCTARASSSSETPSRIDVIDVRKVPIWTLLYNFYLQATSPNKFAVRVLDGHKFAWTKAAGFPAPDSLLIADPETIQKLMPNEWKLGSVTGWPETISLLLGGNSLAITKSEEQHQRLRGIFSPMWTDKDMARMLPNIQSTVQQYMREWAAKGTVIAYTEVLTVVFDVLVNQAMQLGWSDADTRHYAEVFEVWNQGFTPIKNTNPNSAFSKGLAARKELIARFRQSLNDPALTQGSIPATLKDAYGPDSDVCTDNLIMVIFAGFETTASCTTGLLYHLAQQPALLAKLRAEQQAASEEHAGQLSLKSLGDMPFTEACISEVLRIAQIVASVPREATKAIDIPGAPKIPSGCPFSAAWGGMSVLDPAFAGDVDSFKPERWLDASIKDYQQPFGYGQHSCLGFRIARAVAVAVAQELALQYNMAADTDTKFSDFPTGYRPKNGLPLTLTPLA